MTASPTMAVDVAILGGGLAGLCLALQLRQRRPSTRVLVIERRAGDPTEAAFKVGESSVEIGSHYLEKVLGLGDLLGDELKKFGLRFFFSANGNHDIAQRVEVGPGRYLTVPSYQIDRGRFESSLTRRVVDSGARVLPGHTVKDITGLDGAGDKTVHALGPDGPIEVTAPWVIDASGRAELLKRRLELKAETRHRVNASWFRLEATIDLEAWSDDRAWRETFEEPRRLSTNHLMGPGYWVWLIPLAGGQTSVGIVADEALHGFDELRTFERSLEWLGRHEPQLRAEITPHLDRRLDFLTYKHFARSATSVFSADHWCLTGEAGTFNDPLYSPGSDFIGMSNDFITDLVCRQLEGEDIGELASTYEQRYMGVFRTVTTIYRDQYPIMGSARVMSLKIIWDFTMYWGGIALLYMHDKLRDNPLMDRARPVLLGFAGEGFAMQRLFRRWSQLEPDGSNSGFVDYCALPFLAELNRQLLEPMDDETLLGHLGRNLVSAQELATEIRAQASRCDPSLASPDASEVTSSHLAEVIGTLWPPAGARMK